MAGSALSNKMDDHALESVPDSERQGWLKLSWNTAGIVTTLIQLFFGALVAFVAGIKIAVICGVIVVVVGALLGWGVGHVGYKTGQSSTLMTRSYGLGNKGSVLSSAIFGFMIIGFLALENALLYKGFIFFLGIEDTVTAKILIYSGLTMSWIFLTAYGFELVAKVSSLTLIAFLMVLFWMVVKIIGDTGQSFKDALTFGAQFPPEALQGMGITDDKGKYIFGINLLIGSAGALALVDGDFGRYAKRSKDIGIAALLGNISMSILMLTIGAIVTFAGFGKIVSHYVSKGIPESEASQLAMSPDGIAATFILFGGVIGFVLMVLAQAKAQVLNTYSGSLALTNLSDALLAWRPGRFVFVILANIIGLVMLYGNLLALVESWITILGVLTTSLAGIIIADYFFVSDKKLKTSTTEAVNIAGVITLIGGTLLAHYVLKSIIPIEFATSLLSSLIIYPILRRYVFKPPSS